MEQVNAQTEKIASYETSRTRRSIVDGSRHSDDSNNDDEYASSGFYVREKSSDKKTDLTSSAGKGSNIEVKENGNLTEEKPSSSPLLNGDSKADEEADKSVGEPEKKDDNIEPENEEESEVQGNSDEDDSSQEKSDEHGKPDQDQSIEDISANISEEQEKTAQDELMDEKCEEEEKTCQDEPIEEKGEEQEKTVQDRSIEGKVETREKTDQAEPIEEKSEEQEKSGQDKSIEEKIETEGKTDQAKLIEEESEEQEKSGQDKSIEEKIQTQGKTDQAEPIEEESEEQEKSGQAKSIEQKIEAQEKTDQAEPIEEKSEEQEKTGQDKPIEDKIENQEKNDKAELMEEESEEPGKTDQIESIKESAEEQGLTSQDEPVEQKSEESDVSSSNNKATDEPICSSSNNNEENNVSSTSNNVDELVTVDLSEKEEIEEGTADKGDTNKNKELKDTDKVDGKEVVDNHSKELDKNAKESDVSGTSSILKGQLEKSLSNAVEETNDQDVDMDDDFDTSLLCPDISMDVDEVPVMTNTDPHVEDGSTSPLPYEPIFSTLVDEITGAEVHIDLTPEEMEMRQKMYGPDNPVQTTKVHCTACNVHLGSALTGANNRFVHPLLKVLICKNCYHFYTSGEFEKDEDGSELYCRWCGQGGQVLCCSSCEFVFCKRCIRNNFGPRKFKEIRNSDDWNCFRCEPEQLSNLRASCAEFMEYYRTELGRAQSLSATNPELMTIDYTKCCSTPPEKKDESKTPTPQKTRRKRKDIEDPDYMPIRDGEEPPAKKPVPPAGPGYSVIPSNSARAIVPKPQIPQTTIRQVGTLPLRPQMTMAGQVFKVGNTTFKTKTPLTATSYTVQRPLPFQGPRNASPGYITVPTSSGPKTTTPGYIKIVPQRMTTPARAPGSYTVVSGTNNGKPTFSTVRSAKPNQMPQMKHEWFEKTVRAAARVNSNLSYTLTQLNRQQSQAGSVEALAMVHNKLQEVLSTSINSLIQIRKNLRTEFIAGIKNIKFPPKAASVAPLPQTTAAIVVKDDDDVIFVSPTTTASQLQPPPLVLSPSITLTRKPPVQKSSDKFSNPTPSTSGLKTTHVSKPVKPAQTTTTASIGPIKGGFLKVRSLTALQTVPSECITIPDDPPAPAPSVQDDSVQIIESDPLKIIETVEVDEDQPDKNDDNSKSKAQSKNVKAVSSPVPSTKPKKVDPLMVYNVKKKPTNAVRKMMAAHVALKRSPEVEELLRSRGLMNGNSDKIETDDSDVEEIKCGDNEIVEVL